MVKIDNSLNIYLSENLLDKIEKSSNYTITVVEAPNGYGKTTLVEAYVENSAHDYKWINVTSDSKAIFWADFCDNLGELSKENENLLRTSEYPSSEKNVAEIKRLLKKITVTDKTYIVIDNYQFVESEYFDLLISVLDECIDENLHFFFLTQCITSESLLNAINSKKINYINKEDFELSTKEITELFRKNNLEISSKDAEKLYNETEGWANAIILQMIYYKENGELNTSASVDALLDKTVWQYLTDNEQKFIIGLSRLGKFTIKEALMLIPDEFNAKNINSFLNSSIFLGFDRSNRNYYIRQSFVKFLDYAFEALDKENKDILIIKIGSIYEYRDKILDAYKYYYSAKAWDLIYKTAPAFDKLYPYINSENKEFFLDLVKKCPYEINKQYYYFPIIMCFVLFIYNEKDLLLDYLMNIVYSIEDNDNLTEREKSNLLGTVYYVRGYTEFNNIPIMNQFFKKSVEYSGSPVIDLTAKVPFTFSCPSILHLFHSEGESVDNEVEQLNECMPNYYKISEGHGKGAEALMKAEVLYNRGDLEGAETLCHKALYMADSRGQISITLGSILLLTRMSIFEGDFENYMNNFQTIKKKVPFSNGLLDAEYVKLIDLCEGFLYTLFNDTDKISDWLKNSETIESRLSLITMSYANIIYGKYLYLSGEYQKLLGISGEFLGLASIYSYEMPRIYTYIYIAMANKELGNSDKSDKMLKIAMETAKSNGLIMPFVENYEFIGDLLDKISIEVTYSAFIKSIKSLSKKYITGKKSIEKNIKSKENYGLTARELDVAKLAALRYSNKEIADKLIIAESTVKSNMKIIFSKLNITSRQELSKFF